MSFALLIGLLFFVSGFTGLLYEVIWAKYLALLLGSSAYAQVGVLAVFMGGLALGSIVWGKLADRSARPLLVYGALEIGIGVCAAAFALSFDLLSTAYWTTLAAAGGTGRAALAVKTALCIVAMLAPTFCMGGTLPVLSRALELPRRGLGRGVAYLYAVNSLGAASGAVVTGFYLVANWGFDAPFCAAAAVNMLVGAVAMAMAYRRPVLPTVHAESSIESGLGGMAAANAVSEVADVRGYFVLVLTGAAISGAVAMIYEVAWIRLCGLVLGSSTYSFSIMLAAFITGIAAGSLVFTLLDPARQRPLRFFAYASLLAAATLLLCLPAYDRLPYYLGRLTALLRQHGGSLALYQMATLFLCLIVMLPLTFTSGVNFPALAHAAARVRAGIGRPVSQVLFANTAGTIGGAVVGGLYLLPALGLRGTFVLGIAATMAIALAVLACDRALSRARRLTATVAALGGLAAYAVWVPPWELRLLAAGEYRSHGGISAGSFGEYRASLGQELLFYRDGASATVSVERQPSKDIALRVNGKTDATANGDSDTELLFGHLPAVLLPGARHALVIGYGSGITVGALLQHPIASVDVVEISPEVIAADEFFRAYNHNALRDPRTHLFIEDARTFLYRPPRRYDLIISEPSNPWIAGIGNLFTEEFFAQARGRLTPGGLLVQWFHTYETSDEIVAAVLRTVSRGFGEVRVFQSVPEDLLLVASPAPRTVSREAMQHEFSHAGDLRVHGITRLATILGLEILPDKLVRRLAGSGPLNRDRMPILEYAAPRAFFDGEESTLVADLDEVEVDGFVQSGAELTRDDYPELSSHIRRPEMLQRSQTLRVAAGWLARAPLDAEPLDFLARWMAVRPDSPLLLPALIQAAHDVDPALQADYARAVLRVVRSQRLNPDKRDIAAIVPVVLAVAQGSPQRVELFRQLGDLYVAARAYPEAVESFDAALAQSTIADHGTASAALQCARGGAFEKMGNAAAAREAYRLCLQGDASNPTATAGLRRVDATDRGP